MGVAMIPGCFRCAFLPELRLKAEPGYSTTGRAWHKESPLVGGQILPLNPAAAGDRGCGVQESLAMPAEAVCKFRR